MGRLRAFFNNISNQFSKKANRLHYYIDEQGRIEGGFEKNYWHINNIFIRDRLHLRKININKVTTIFVFVLIYISICVVFRPWLIFSLTTTAGGDMGTHHYGVKFILDNLLSQFRVTGWSNGWYAGMPINSFYFPFPYLAIALLSKIIPYNIAFKLITVLGSFILPACAYWMIKLMRFRYPYPLLGALGASLFLFTESYSIYGGNFLSTLAGEFGYSLSFALGFLFIGTMHLAIEKGSKFNWLFVLNCFLLMAVALSHVLTTICLLVILPWLLLENRQSRNIWYMVSVLITGFLLTAFWSVPFALKLKYTPNMGWVNLKNFKPLVTVEMIPLVILAVIGIIIYIIVISRRDDKRNIPLTISYLLLNLAFFIPSGGRIWNARLLPYIFIIDFFLAGYTLFILFGFLMIWLRKYRVSAAKIAALIFVPLIALGAFAVRLPMQPKAAGWATYNYSGYEKKPYWKIYSLMMAYIETKPEGRYMIEQNHDALEKLGTTRAFELIPFWTKSATMEGLLAEGAFTSPFHFTEQALMSEKPSNAIPGLKLPSLNIKAGVENLRMMNIRYMVSSSEKVQGELDKHPDAKLMAKFDVFNFYEINTTNKYIEILKNVPVKVQTDNWYETILPWFKKYDKDRTFVIWDQGENGLESYKSVSPEEVLNIVRDPYEKSGEVLEENIENEKITFRTTAVGIPHIVKISYFPNWKAEGADGPYAVSPSLMMVIPRQENVTLYYGSTITDIIARSFTQAAWIFLVVLLAADRTKYIISIRKNKNKK
ncbi:MAG: glycosyltransferase family protein [Candidatus Humimicrobiaceae bacterium]